MPHKRSGAKRRAILKAALRQQRWEREHEEQNSDSKDVGCNIEDLNTCKIKSRKANAGQPSQPARKQGIMPEVHDVLAAVASLYIDALKPFGRILRKRISERYLECAACRDAARESESGNVAGSTVLLDVDAQHLRRVCDGCNQLSVHPEDAGDWSVTLVGCPEKFVDIYSTVDAYPEDLWTSLISFLEHSSEHDSTLPGGRYSCAKALHRLRLPFLKGISLGQLCHIVQLALGHRKVFGYHNGWIVPYSRSQARMKEKCAVKQQPIANPSPEAADLPYATWEQAVTSLGRLLAGVAVGQANKRPGVIALSSVKRSFRTKFQLELSETVLGYSKLSDLLQDCRFHDTCFVQLEEHGYSVVQNTLKSKGSEAEPHTDSQKIVSSGHTLQLAETDDNLNGAPSNPTSISLDTTAIQSSQHTSASMAVDDDSVAEARRLHLICNVGLSQVNRQHVEYQLGQPLCEHANMDPARNTFGSKLPSLSPYLSARCVHLGSMVRNTFIHAAPTPPTPARSNMRRCASLPKNLNKDNSNHQAAFLPWLLQDCSNMSGSTTARSVTSSRGKDKVKCNLIHSPRQGDHDADSFLDNSDCLIDDLYVGVRQQRTQCPCEPLSLEDVASPEENHLRLSGTSGQFAPRWTVFSPSALTKDSSLGGLVRNTFIHANLPPPTPASSYRSVSLPKDLGSQKKEMEAVQKAVNDVTSRDAGTSQKLHNDKVSVVSNRSPSNSYASPGFALRSPALTASPGARLTPLTTLRTLWPVEVGATIALSQ